MADDNAQRLLALQQQAAQNRGENVGSTSQNLNGGAALGGAATGAAAGAALGPWGAAAGGVIGGLAGLFSGGDNSAPQAPSAQFAAGNGSDLTNHLAALQYSEGLSQQQAQNAREAAFYNQANGNFDIGNAAQLRGPQQIEANQADQQRQLQALGATNASGQQMTDTGNLLTQMGTAPQGASYAEAQLRQGQDAAMAQQLSQARSGRSLGSGQASMNQAMFNNAALNQQTNLAAANARLQEQQNYNQFQLGALQGAGNAYGGAGALAGQAGNQSTAIRSGNEGLQAQNAALGQSQQQINNQTTGLYNQLGAQQQGLGMQANQQGQNAYQFGQQQGQNMQTAQLNANLGQATSQTATNIANQNNANTHQAANMNMAASGLGAVANAAANWDSGGGSSSSSASPYANITTASHYTPSGGGDLSSDERAKTNIRALGGDPASLSPVSVAYKPDQPGKYAEFDPKTARAYENFDLRAAAGNADQSQLVDTDTNKVGVTGEGPSNVASYYETINALNNAYRGSQSAPADVLNHVAGAGAGPSDSQAAVLAALGRPVTRAVAPYTGAVRDLEPNTTDQIGRYRTTAPLTTFDREKAKAAAAPAPIAAPAPPANWGDVFNAPTLDPRVQAYLNGYSAQAAPTPTPQVVIPQKVAPYEGVAYTGGGDHTVSTVPVVATGNGNHTVAKSKLISTGGGNHTIMSDIGSKTAVRGLDGGVLSDQHSKSRIRELETQLAALSAPQQPPTASFAPQAPDYAALDAAYARQQQPPGVDFRNAHGYEYEYKDPKAVGAAPGRQVGTMAQELEQTSAAPYVHDTPHGKQVDTARLPLALAPAIGETQTRVDELERQLNALQGSGLRPYATQPGFADPRAY
ncbi:hypothetical protein [Nevskia sp.]|uniref:hypothetical protein n=1 Tax=Nevskia sp. TaxID=1929292 RepID=UPI0025E44F1F|nr:hypothetical protein [Nevskia sp.]